MIKLLLAAVILIPQFAYNPALAAKPKQPAPQARRCIDFASLLDAAEKGFGETPHFVGRMSPKSILVIMINDETHTWTLVTVNSEGDACPVQDGVGWKAMHKEEGSPS